MPATCLPDEHSIREIDGGTHIIIVLLSGVATEASAAACTSDTVMRKNGNLEVRFNIARMPIIAYADPELEIWS